MGRPSKNSLKNNVELNYVDVNTITDSTPPEINKVEADAWDQLANGEQPDILKESSEEAIEDVKRWAEGTPPEAVEAILREQVHIMGHDIVTETIVEDIPTVTPELINALVQPSPQVIKEVEVELEAPKYKSAANGAVRNLFAINREERPVNTPTIASAKQAKPHSVKSMEGTRTGMFRINPDKPIRN